MSLITMTEFWSIDSEHNLFREIKGFEIESKIELSIYNRRKRKLISFNNAQRLILYIHEICR